MFLLLKKKHQRNQMRSVKEVLQNSILSSEASWSSSLGQFTLKWSSISQKTNTKIQFYYYGTSSRIVFVRFLEELKTPQRNFEIKWPLVSCVELLVSILVEPVDHRFLGSNLSTQLRIDQVLRLFLYWRSVLIADNKTI